MQPHETAGLFPTVPTTPQGTFESSQVLPNHDLPYFYAAAKVISGVVVRVAEHGGDTHSRTVVDGKTAKTETEEIFVPENHVYVAVRFDNDSCTQPFLDAVEEFRRIDENQQ